MKLMFFLGCTTALMFITATAFAVPVKGSNCRDYVRIKDVYTPEYLAVIDGFDKSGRATNGTLDVGGIITEADQVKMECIGKGKETVAAARRNADRASSSPDVTSAAKKTAFIPSKARCSDYVALSEEYRPVAAFWVAGNSRGGQIKTGEIDETNLSRPIVTLFEDCKAHPTASFYDRAKVWAERTF